MSKNKDLSLGYKGELQFYQKYKRNLEWLSLKDKYSFFDFKKNNTFIELKTRRYRKSNFDDGGHIIETHKLEWLEKNNYKGIIIYTYIDGTFYYKVNRNNNSITKNIGGNIARGDKLKELSFINGKYLKLLNKNLTTPSQYPFFNSKNKTCWILD